MPRGLSCLTFMLILLLGGVFPAARADESLTERYREPAGRIIGAALTDVVGWEKLTHLTTEIGHRLAGSTGLERAIEWAHAGMKKEGLENAILQPVKVPHWVRGNEYAEVVAPVRRTLSILGLGRSIATPAEGITAPVVVVESFDELQALGRGKVEGKNRRLRCSMGGIRSYRPLSRRGGI